MNFEEIKSKAYTAALVSEFLRRKGEMQSNAGRNVGSFSLREEKSDLCAVERSLANAWEVLREIERVGQ